MKKSLLILLPLFLFVLRQAKGQELSTPVTVHLAGQPIGQLAEQVERQTPFRFYFDASALDSLRLTGDFDQVPLKQVLDKLLEKTNYHYSFFRSSIYLTKDKQIITELPSQFVPDKKETKRAETIQIAELTTEKAAIPATLENKIYTIGSPGSEKGSARIAGYIKSAKTGEPVTGVAIFIAQPRIGTTTDQFGFYSLLLPKGRHELIIRAVGIKDTKRQIVLNADGKLDINVQEQLMSLKEVVISADKASNIRRTPMGLEKLDIKTIKQVPTVFGEADVLRGVLTLPGVKSVGESSTGFNVRGGAVDQNLILFNDATVYNPSHFFGFFSAFNPEVIKDVQLYKSSIPAKYGGRLSSVLELNGREGNKKEITGTAGIGLLTSRLNVEGPIIKDKTSFILGGRTTYSNWILDLLPDKAGYKGAKASFYDLNLNLSHQQNEKNSFYFTGYFSKDRSNLASDTSYSYNNQNYSLRWKHIFSNKFHSVFTTGLDKYQYENFSDFQEEIAYNLKFDIRQNNLKAAFSYFFNSKQSLDFGLNSIYYNLRPGTLKPLSNNSLIVQDVIQKEQALENALYGEYKWDVTRGISLNAGLRYSLFSNLGPGSVNIYAPGLTKTDENILETKEYNKGELVRNYQGPEYRVGARFALSTDFSVKASYNSLRQYIHMLSNTTAMSPTDVWKLSDMNIKPQNGNQVSLGLYKNFKRNTIETSVEGYFKRLNNYLDYKSGATLVLNHKIEQDVLETQGKAYGIEFLVKKLTGKLNGWLSYTYSKTMLKTEESSGANSVNQGNYYPSNYDKPHDLTFIGNYRFSHRYSFSLNTTCSTGRPITLPVGKYYYLGAQRVLYSERNQYRIPDYFRSDVSLNIEGNHKVHQLTHNSWTFGIYNLTGRKNAYASYFATENGVINGYKLSIFGSAIPFVNYNIRFK